MTIVDIEEVEGRTYPARRRTRNLVGGSSPVQMDHFSMGHSLLEPNGGQVPWHNHEQEEVYYFVSGIGEMCVGDEVVQVKPGQMVFIPSMVFHQLTNVGDEPLVMIYCYAPAGDVDHWRQELAGTLPVAGVDVPALPAGASPQHTTI